MCSQKPDCFPGWTHLNLMTLPCQERRMFPPSCHLVRNLSHTRSAVNGTGRKEDDRKVIDIRERALSLPESIHSHERVPISGSGFQLSFGSNIAFNSAPALYVSSRRLTALSAFRELATRSVFSVNPSAKWGGVRAIWDFSPLKACLLSY